MTTNQIISASYVIGCMAILSDFDRGRLYGIAEMMATDNDRDKLLGAKTVNAQNNM